MTPIRLRPIAERDALLTEYLETVALIDPATGEAWRPDGMDDDEDEYVKQSETHPTMKEMTGLTHDETNQGPLRLLPSPPDVATRRVVGEKLSGHAAAANWLVEGLTPELDALPRRASASP